MRQRFRLNDNHPAAKRLARVFEVMEEQGVRIEVTRMGDFLFIDTQAKEEEHYGKFYELSDCEDGSSVGCIPPVFEYKLTYEKEVPDAE